MQETAPSVPVQTPAAAPVAAEFTTPSQADSSYESNPFLVVTKGIVSILHYNPGSALLMAVALLGVTVAGMLVLGLPLILIHNTFVNIFLGLLAFLAYFAFLGLSVGTYLSVGSASIRGQKTTVKASFARAVSRLLPLVGVSILGGIIVVVGFVLLIVPGFFVLGRLSLATVVLMEENLGPIAALKRSWALTDKHTIEMLGALFAGQVIGFGGAGLLTPTLAIAPLFGRYTDLVAFERSGSAAKPKIHWLNYLAFIAMLPLIALSIFIGILAHSGIKMPAPTTTMPSQNMNPYQGQTLPQSQSGAGSGTLGGSGTNLGSDTTGTPTFNYPTTQ